MAQNKVLEQNQPLQLAVPAAAAVTSNQPLLFGVIPCVANESYSDATRPTRGFISVDAAGAFNLAVTAVSTLSPAVNSAVNVGDKIYAKGGTTDAPTGITYGFTLCKDATGTLFGTAISVAGASGVLISSGASGTIAVRLYQGGQ